MPAVHKPLKPLGRNRSGYRRRLAEAEALHKAAQHRPAPQGRC